MSRNHSESSANFDQSKPVYDLGEAASLLRVSVPTVRRFIKQGELRPTRLGKRVLILNEDLVDFLKKKRGV